MSPNLCQRHLLLFVSGTGCLVESMLGQQFSWGGGMGVEV